VAVVVMIIIIMKVLMSSLQILHRSCLDCIKYVLISPIQLLTCIIFSVGDRSVSESFCWTLSWAAVCWFYGLLRYIKRSHSPHKCKYHNYL